MTVHPRAGDFAALQLVCNTVQKDHHSGLHALVEQEQPDAAGQVIAAEEAETWYRYCRDELTAQLAAIGVEPLCVLRRSHWKTIRNLYGLFELDVLGDYIQVRLPDDWVQSYAVDSVARGYEGDRKVFIQYSQQALAAAATLEQKEILKLLMPNHQSLSFDIVPDVAHANFSIELPPAPVREQVVMKRLQASGAPFHITADPGAIAFAPPLGEQMRGANTRVRTAAKKWRDYEPIITVSSDEAVAIVGQWGDYIFEGLAIQAALAQAG